MCQMWISAMSPDFGFNHSFDTIVLFGVLIQIWWSVTGKFIHPATYYSQPIWHFSQNKDVNFVENVPN